MSAAPQPQQHINNETLGRQYITFTVKGQEYGLDIMAVREIKGWSATTSLPNTPEYIRGVINLRGVVVPILDLRARFGMGLTNATKNHVVMIASVDERIIGILVDSVSDILTVNPDEIRPVPELDGDRVNAFSGLVSVEDRLVGLIILEQLIDQSTHLTQQDLSILTNDEDVK